MRTITRNYEVYTFDELSEEAKEQAICDHVNFWCEVGADHSEGFKKAVADAERMRTPWFLAGYVYDYCKDEIIAEIKLNDYTFTKDGKHFPLKDGE